MSWILKNQEVQSVLLLDGSKRYSYFIKKVSDESKLWSLRQRDAWILYADDAGQLLIPVWPHEKYAALCAHGEAEGSYPEAIELDAWLDRWIPGMEKDRRSVAVFPTPGQRGVVVEPKSLESDLREELSQYE